MFDLTRPTLPDTFELTEQTARLRSVTGSAQDFAHRLLTLLTTELRTEPDSDDEPLAGGRSVALAQAFAIRRFDELPGAQQDRVRSVAGADGVRSTQLCAMLLSRVEPAASRPSEDRIAAALPSPELTGVAPTLADVAEVALGRADEPRIGSALRAKRGRYAFALVADARKSPVFRSWTGFLLAEGIQSVASFAVSCPRGAFAVVLYARCPIPASSLDALLAVTLGVRTSAIAAMNGALFDVFDADPQPAGFHRGAHELAVLRAQLDSFDDLMTARHELVRREGRALTAAVEAVREREAALTESQAALAGSRAAANALLFGALDAIVVMDASGRVVDWNPAAEELFGYPKAAAIGRQVADLIVPAELRDRHNDGVERFLRTGEGPLLNNRVELTAMTCDGVRVPVELTVTAVELPDRQYLFTGFIRDITSRLDDKAALIASRERFARIARTLQHSLLPADLPQLHGLDVGSIYQPARASSEVGGDFYDVFKLDRQDAVVVLGDVCGKGAEAAAITAIARYTVRAVASHLRHPVLMLRRVNEALLEHDIGERFCSMVTARVTPIVRGVRLTVCCGGHPAPIVVRADGRVERVGVWGGLLGLFSDVKLMEETVQLRAGDLVVFFTDGITEAANDRELFGDDRLAQVLVERRGDSASEMLKHLIDAVLEFGGEPRDDIAALVLKVPA